MSEPVRVLVFGATGVGKTSVCNALTRGSRPTNNGPVGVTSKTHVYGRFNHDGRSIQLIDTVGLHEAETGTVPPDEAILQLVDLLKNSKEGFNLLVHVAKAGRITKQQEEDYDFFVNKMAAGRIPSLLVLTGCENEDPMDSWVQKHGRHYARFNYRSMLACCFAKGGPLESQFAPLREQSRTKVLDAVATLALPAAVKLYGEGTSYSYKSKLAELWNEFVDMAGLPAELRARVNESAYEFLVRLKVPRKLAEAAIKHIPDLIDELPVPGRGIIKKIVQTILGRVVRPS